jgi:hypothetical protein
MVPRVFLFSAMPCGKEGLGILTSRWALYFNAGESPNGPPIFADANPVTPDQAAARGVEARSRNAF